MPDPEFTNVTKSITLFTFAFAQHRVCCVYWFASHTGLPCANQGRSGARDMNKSFRSIIVVRRGWADTMPGHGLNIGVSLQTVPDNIISY